MVISPQNYKDLDFTINILVQIFYYFHHWVTDCDDLDAVSTLGRIGLNL